jgi:hypothetical protein
MKLAVMQPYLLPYIGYYQLLRSVDKFIVFDDVNYINRGWINRNRILVNGKDHMFTLPLENASQNKFICAVNISSEAEKWRRKFFRTMELNYCKAPMYKPVMSFMEMLFKELCGSLSVFLMKELELTCSYLGINTEIVSSSQIYDNRELAGGERIIDICRKEGVDTYINACGGTDIYDKKDFAAHGINLKFIQTGDIKYHQFSNEFVPWLSIVDVMMFNSPAQINVMLDDYELF